MCLRTPKYNNSAQDAQEAQVRADETARQGRITSGQGQIEKVFSGYNQPYYDNLNKDYHKYYDPQLQTQYGDAQQKELFNAANQGTLDSSGYAKQKSDLDKEYGVQKDQVDSGANSYSQNAQSQIAGLKNKTQQQLLASGDNSGINSSLLNQVQIAPAASLSPLVNLFGGLVNSAGQIGANTAYLGGPSLGSKLFNNSGGGGGSSSKYIV